MSRENVDNVKAIWRAFARYEFPADRFARDAVWHTAADLPDVETCVGPEAIQRMLASGWENVIDPKIEVDEVLDAGERVLVRWKGHGTARASGAPMDWRETHSYRLQDGKVVEVQEYRIWQEALDAAGVRQSTMGADESSG
jgi:uncharacterized protein